ncbi:putative apoptosis inhibitory 5 [Helianthus annuus]|nr:putative apoptosis inhibitory 5 [Helianthus annuus]
MADASSDANDIEKLYVYGERLSKANDKSQNVEDYNSIIEAAKSPSVKARQLAAQLITRFFKFFPGWSGRAVDAHLDMCEAEELGVSTFVYKVKLGVVVNPRING